MQLKEHSQVYLLCDLGKDPINKSTHHNLSTLLCQVCDGSGGEVEVTSFERPQHHSVGDITRSESLKLRKIIAFQRKKSE